MVRLLDDIGWNVKQTTPLILNDYSYIDNVNTPTLPNGLQAKNCLYVGKGCEAMYKHTKKYCEEVDTFPLILGGDHCISIGTISAIKSTRKELGIVWV